jgi:hypothetical protein
MFQHHKRAAKTSQLSRTSHQLASLDRSHQGSKTATSLINQLEHVIILSLARTHASSRQTDKRARMDRRTLTA